MVHIMQAEQFYECDYYTPSNDGFHVYNTPFGKVGIVICFDRHLPESIRTCVVMGAKLIIVPTANTKSEPNEMFEWEMRVQAFQNNVFIAMCNRVGVEGDMEFCGNSIVIDPNGDVIFKADDTEQLITAEIDLSEADISRQKRPYIKTRRAEWYL
jgi:predicted amidohydrolase